MKLLSNLLNWEMRHLLCLLTFSLLLFPLAGPSEQTAIVRFDCLSVRFAKATTRIFGQTYTFELTSGDASNPANGELQPVFDPTAPSHGSVFLFQDPSSTDPVVGSIAIDVPPGGDDNDNGFPDFFEVSQEVVATTTQGVFQDDVESGTVTATWRRNAGSTTGTCQLQWAGDTFGDRPDFTATFTVLEYNGVLKYQPGSNQITGSIALEQSGNASNRLEGPISFTKIATNRFNRLTLAGGSWTNSQGDVLTYGADTIERDEQRKTNYFGFVQFRDGDRQTADPDYTVWQISLDDLNDQNRNGIPDFSDDPATATAAQPGLTITLGASNLVFTVQGEPGRSYDLEQTASLTAPAWVQASSITLSNNPQSLLLPAPSNRTEFWRLRVR